MIVYVVMISGGEYEDKWEDISGVFSSKELALEKFEKLKKEYANINSDFYYWCEDWKRCEILKYEVDGNCKTEVEFYNVDEEWKEFDRSGVEK